MRVESSSSERRSDRSARRCGRAWKKATRDWREFISGSEMLGEPGIKVN